MRAPYAALVLALGLAKVARADDAAPKTPPGESEPPPKHVDLQWTRGGGAEGCIAPDALQSGVEKILERKVFVPRATADALVHGRIEKTADGWAAHLAMSSLDGALLGTRDLHSEAADCASLDDTLTLVTALAIDSLRSIEKSADLHVTPAPPPPPMPPPVPPEPWRAEIGAIAHGSYGLLPGVAAGFGFTAAVVPPKFWPIRLDATYWLPSRAEEGRQGAEFTAWELGLSVCAPIIRKIVEPRVCLGASLGRMTGTGFGLPVDGSTTGWLANGKLLGEAFIHLAKRLAVSPAVGLGVPFVRDRFYYTLGDDPARHVVHQATPVVFLFDLGVAVTIP